MVNAGMVLIWYGVGGVIAPVSVRMAVRRPAKPQDHHNLGLSSVCPFDDHIRPSNYPVYPSVSGVSSWGSSTGRGNPHLTILVSEYAGKKWAATANGVANCFFQAAPIVGSVVMGWSIDVTGSFNSVWYIMALGPLLGAILLMFIRPPSAT